MVCRGFAEKLPEYLGQPISFIYKPGAAGTIGASFVAKSKSDGHTLIGSSAALLLNPLTKQGLDYTADNFIPICRLVTYSNTIAVKADSPWKNFKDVAEAAKNAPGKYSFATSGVFSTPHLMMEMTMKAAGIKLTHVPCKGNAPALTALLGGHVDLTVGSIGPVTPHVKSGALRLVAVPAAKRLKVLPDVPTLTEMGIPLIYVSWVGYWAPKGTPMEVVKKFSSACQKVVDNHRNFLEDWYGKMRINLDFLPHEQFVEKVKEENELLKRLVQELKKGSK
jgi:tripartite-type tricarboxylate transporter receptor subunit TctC